MPFPDEEFFYDEFHTQAAAENYRTFKESWPPDKLYCFSTEMHKYLKQDVEVLRGGCVRLLKEMLDFQDEYVSASSSLPSWMVVIASFALNDPFFRSMMSNLEDESV